MRLRIDVRTSADHIPWREVLRPGRGLSYAFLAEQAPELGERLHAKGWGRHGMTPIGHGAPVFPQAKRSRGKYAAGGAGYLEFSSPLLAVVEAWARALPGREVLDWGGVALQVRQLVLLEPPEFTSGRAVFRTQTPVVMKGSGRDDDGARATRQAWLLPGEPEFDVYFERSLRRKAETLDLDPEVSLERITWVGPKRSFAVGGGQKVGAPIEVEVAGDPETLKAIWSWGLGQANSAGFGWIDA